MPFLNMERYLRESVQSVLTQTRRDWELLLINDGSTDRSIDIAESFVRADPERIRLLQHPDRASRGASAARNVGLAHARGACIALLDADDVWVATKLEEQLALMDRHPKVGVLYGRTRWWYSWSADASQKDTVPQLGITPGRPIAGHTLLERMIRNAAEVPTTCSVLIRRDAMQAAGGFEEEFRSVYTDQVFFTKLLLRTNALPVDRCWDWYRRRADSSSTLNPAAMRQARLRFLEWMALHIERGGWADLPLARTVRREMRWVRAPAALQRMHRTVNRLPGRIDLLLRHLRLSRTAPSNPHDEQL